ncbi:ABC transporter ATP-binding protein [Jiangella asiatica]|uniref:ABC transporter ATP-binding protein n=1 Tax=Jiangella asiatica TaxID=2530372 RepID=A0A4R5D9X5_9ACTN|nr:ABC transporter ATP-binding protein [Jiangella asiatica]TDE07365.1 ABC transporter ATP-binding protein [Jiangella asiatica]
MSAPPAVEISALVKRYGPATAVDGLTFTVAAGTITSVLGRNGAGKTTTIETCEGFRRPDAGTVRVLGLDPLRDGARLRPRVGVMLQEGTGFYPGARAAELLTHLARLHAHPLDVGPLVDRLGLAGSGPTPLRRLSGGERQRVALAAALVGRPELVFLDEPTAGLDPQARRDTWDLLTELRADGVTVVLTTHLIDEAERLSDHVVIIDAGRLLAEGSPQELTAGAADDIIRFGGPPRLDLASLRAALPAAAQVHEVAPGTYEVAAVVDPRLLATLTSWCAANDILAEGLQVGHRTLEDVFLELTGRVEGSGSGPARGPGRPARESGPADGWPGRGERPADGWPADGAAGGTGPRS